jgi:predicted Zn finger-like uncharacterized protein
MKFVCDRCQTKYSIADERVRGKILKVKCKSCANVITVREPRRASGPVAPLNATGHDSERTVLAPNPVAMMAEAVVAPPAAAPRRPSGPVPTLAPDDGLAWYMALSGERSGPFTRRQLVDKVMALPKNADLHVWNEQLGAWKPPAEVPAIASDMAARRKAPPPLPPGAPRRPTPAPPAPPVIAPATKAPGVAPSIAGPPLAAAGGLRLPPPTGGTRPRPSLSSMAAVAPAVARAAASDPGVDIDPSSMLETPAPQPHMLHGHGAKGTNGTSAHSPASATTSSSDVLKLLNLPGAPQPAAATADGAAPRLMSADAVGGWAPSTQASGGRARNTKLIVGFLGVLAVIIVVVAFSVMSKKAPPPPIAAPKTAVTDPLAGVVDKMATAPIPTPTTPPPTIAPIPEPPAPPPAGRVNGKVAKGRGPKGRGGAAPGPIAAATPGGSSPAPVDPNARYRDTGPGLKVTPQAAATRPPPSQSQILSVINANRNGIKTCYQRALVRDNSLARGKVTVKLTIGISGRVKQVGLDGPSQFRVLEPCVKDIISRWVFPQGPDEYATEFVSVFQGNE